MNQLPETGFLRLSQIIGNPNAVPPIPPIIPVKKSTWWAGVKSGRYPQPGVWCCALTNAANIPHDYVERTGQVADLSDASYAKHYKATDGANYFGWADSASMSARELAAAFIQRFPDLAGRSQGQDWLYAGWLTSILGIAESGRMPVLFGPRNELVAVVPVPPPSFA